MGNKSSRRSEAGGSPSPAERDPDAAAPPPESDLPAPVLDELRKLLVLAGGLEPDSDGLVDIVHQIFELLLTDEGATFLDRAPELCEVAVAKAYEFSEVGRLAWVTQNFLAKHHPEGLFPGGAPREGE